MYRKCYHSGISSYIKNRLPPNVGYSQFLIFYNKFKNPSMKNEMELKFVKMMKEYGNKISYHSSHNKNFVLDDIKIYQLNKKFY